MGSYFLIWLLILFVGTIVGYIIVKNILKTVVTFLFIIFLFATITIILTYSDIQDVKQELGEKEVIVIIHENQALLFGDVEKNLWSDENETEHREITIEQNVLKNYVALKRYNVIIEEGEYYKVFAINKSFYDPLNEEIKTSTGVKTKTELLALLQDPAYAFEERAEAVETLNQEILNQEGMRYIIEQYKEESIVIYPKTMVFRILEIIPTDWLSEEEVTGE